MHESDEAIVTRVQNGDVDAFGVLVERYEGKITRYGRRFLFQHNHIEDLVQEVFIKAYINIQSFDTKRKFSSWLYRIAHNEFVNELKRSKREPLPLLDADTTPTQLVDEYNVEESISQHELIKQLHIHVQSLPRKYKEPIILFYFEEMSYQEISDVMHIPVSTVGTRIKRGKALLKEYIPLL